MDVELRDPQDLQTAMYYARAFERRAAAMQPTPPPRAARPPHRPAPLPARPPGGAPAAPNPASAANRSFRRLTPAEQLEHRRQGLCFNCDEPYVPGHVCQRLFYLESGDYLVEDEPAADVPAATAAPEVEATQEQEPANAFVVSLHALAGIRTDNTMLLPVVI